MLRLSLEEFASQRRTAQSGVEAALLPLIRRALDTSENTNGWSEVLAEALAQYRTAYTEESGLRNAPGAATFLAELHRGLKKTDRGAATDATADRIAAWLATSILSFATERAAIDDPEETILEWVDMDDARVRPTHREASGQQRPVGEKFTVGGHRMRRPGDTTAPIEEWINCRCTLRQVLAKEALVASETFGGHDLVWVENRRTPKVVSRGAKYEPTEAEGKITRRREANAEEEKTIARGDWVRVNDKGDKPSDSGYKRKKSKVRPGPHTNALEAMAQRAGIAFADEPLDEPTHAGFAVYAADTGRLLMLQRTMDPEDAPEVQGTWEFPGGGIEDGESPEEAARREFMEETGLPIPEGEVTNGWRSPDGVYQGYVYTVPVEADAFTEINPDLAAAEVANPDDPERRSPDVTAWFTVEQIKNLGPALRPEVAKTDWSIFGQDSDEETPVSDENETTDPGPVAAEARVPWHGVLAPEGVPSGDGRQFAEGSLTSRPLPLPLTWQKTSADGHTGNVTVARIDRIERVGNEMRGAGVFLTTVEADEALGLIADFGRFGVSIDADQSVFEMDEDSQSVVFSKARIAGSCIVPIPAFSQAWVALGKEPDDFWGGEPLAEEGDPVEVPEDEGDDVSLVAADVAPGRTEDGPGWLTDPVPTDRLRDYWVDGPGAAKIGWGTPGDFDRCRVNVAEYVKPQYLNGYCANRHYDALGVWPGQESSAADSLEFKVAAEALSLTASAGHCAPSEWFQNPNLDRLTPMTITEEGRVFGHIAGWKTCHSSWADECVLAPRSATGYSHFLLGEVLTDAGMVPVGSLTIGGGHAGPRKKLRAAIEHYDSSTSVFADVTCGEDEHGIWFAGWVRPGTSPEMVHAARASKLSGDWRRNPSTASMEMIAALAVNVPGYRVPRIAAAMEGTQQISLVAAGAVVEDESGEPIQAAAVDLSALATAVAVEMVGIQTRREQMAALAASRKKG